MCWRNVIVDGRRWTPARSTRSARSRTCSGSGSENAPLVRWPGSDTLSVALARRRDHVRGRLRRVGLRQPGRERAEARRRAERERQRRRHRAADVVGRSRRRTRCSPGAHGSRVREERVAGHAAPHARVRPARRRAARSSPARTRSRTRAASPRCTRRPTKVTPIGLRRRRRCRSRRARRAPGSRRGRRSPISVAARRHDRVEVVGRSARCRSAVRALSSACVARFVV